jgi:hypothetical protein
MRSESTTTTHFFLVLRNHSESPTINVRSQILFFSTIRDDRRYRLFSLSATQSLSVFSPAQLFAAECCVFFLLGLLCCDSCFPFPRLVSSSCHFTHCIAIAHCLFFFCLLLFPRFFFSSSSSSLLCLCIAQQWYLSSLQLICLIDMFEINA